MKQEILDLGFENLKIYQAPDGYCFTSDSVLLANYIKCHKTDKVAEFCAGSGVISILLSKKQNPEKIYAFELQKRLCDMFSKSVKLNNLENQIQPINAKLEDCLNFLSRASLDVVFCNPPYMESGDHSDNQEIALATHEIGTNLDSILENAEKLLKYGGKFYIVHRTDRLADVICAFRNHHIEPKKLCIVYPNQKAEPAVFLMMGTKYGKKGLRVSKAIYAEDFKYSTDSF